MYGKFRLLSLDVALGALGGGMMVASYLNVEMNWSWYVILPLAVWAIYTADHLMDAFKLKSEASTARHKFHHDHFNLLMALAGLAALSCVVLALLFLGQLGFYFGLGMGAFVLLHLSLVKVVGERTSPLLVKELGVASIYALGIWGLPILEAGRWQDPSVMLPLLQFFMMAFANLLEFSLFEHDLDEADGQTSFVRALGKPRSLSMVRFVLAIAVAIGVFVLTRSSETAVMRLELLFSIMAGILSALVYRMDWFAQNERYRAWGDGVFLLPFLYAFAAWV